MNGATQQEKATLFRRLHKSGEMLVLPNIWNPIGARVLQAKGYPAAATASAAVSASLGYADGEKIRRDTLLEVISRIARSVEIPVTADIEAGYATSSAELDETIVRVVAAGFVGINIEDSVVEGGALRAIDEQCDRIATVRAAAHRVGIPLVINARTDCFVSGKFDSPTARITECVLRAKVYADAGADCIYPMGPGDRDTLAELRDRIPVPLNALASPAAEPLRVLRAIGINRVSFGPFIFRSCLSKFVGIVDALTHPTANYASIADTMLSQAEVAVYLADGPE